MGRHASLGYLQLVAAKETATAALDRYRERHNIPDDAVICEACNALAWGDDVKMDAEGVWLCTSCHQEMHDVHAKQAKTPTH